MALPRSDIAHLEAARCWLEEFDRMRPRLRAHPDILCIRWLFCTATPNWELALEIAQTLAERNPDDSFWLIRVGWSLYELNRFQEAYDRLKPLLGSLPEDYHLRYYLSRSCCKLGKPKEAMDYLETAIELAGKNDIWKRALNDLALAPLWANISKMRP